MRRERERVEQMWKDLENQGRNSCNILRCIAVHFSYLLLSVWEKRIRLCFSLCLTWRLGDQEIDVRDKPPCTYCTIQLKKDFRQWQSRRPCQKINEPRNFTPSIELIVSLDCRCFARNSSCCSSSKEYDRKTLIYDSPPIWNKEVK